MVRGIKGNKPSNGGRAALRLLCALPFVIRSLFVIIGPGTDMDTVLQKSEVDELLERLESRDRLSFDDWKIVEDQAATEDLGSLADCLRHTLHPDDVVTYVVDRNVNYSNVCVSVCTFCAFYRKPGSPEGYVHSFEEIFQKVEEMLELGGSGVLMQGGLHPDLPLDY
jgi:cyclic dehypoxanthinyl futalosine synthase